MNRIFTSKEREQLTKRHRQEQDKPVCDRIKAILAYDDGCSYSEIARILLLDDETIRCHIDDYQQDQKLNPINGGSSRNLTGRETCELIDHPREITYFHAKDICHYVCRNSEVYLFAKRLGIKLHYLPPSPYSPNLNLVERGWKLMHESVRYNKYYDKFSEFAEATIRFFKGIGRKNNILRERITDNFKILHSPMFAS